MKPYSKEWEAACEAGKIANTLDCERTHKKLSSPTCLELAKKENELLYKYLSNKVDESNHYKKLWIGACVMLSHAKLRIFFYVLAVALIAFTGGIWFTWEKIQSVNCSQLYVHIGMPQSAFTHDLRDDTIYDLKNEVKCYKNALRSDN